MLEIQNPSVSVENKEILHEINLQMNPVARCIGENAAVSFNSVMVAPKGSNLDVGSLTILNTKD